MRKWRETLKQDERGNSRGSNSARTRGNLGDGAVANEAVETWVEG
jgi:hypothetical protein